MSLIRLLFSKSALLIVLFCTMEIYSQIRIKAVGDIMLGSRTPKEIIPPDSGKIFIRSIGSLLKNSDLVFGNLEGALVSKDLEPKKCSENSRMRKTCYEFGMPLELAPVLKQLGFNILSLDNNHSFDYGYEGYLSTQKTLSNLKIKFAQKKGSAEFIIDSTKICVVAFGYSESSYHISDPENARKVVDSMSAIYDIVIVSFHGGAEGPAAMMVPDSTEFYLNEDRGNVFQFAHAVVDAGADLVIGHGPHVLRAMEIYKNKLIAYSMGNFLTYGNFNIDGMKGISAVLNVSMDQFNGNFISGSIVPLKQTEPGIPYFDNSKNGIKILQRLSKTNFPGSRLKITDDGKIYFISPDFYILNEYLRFQSLVHILN